MPIAAALKEFKQKTEQCERLIANAHQIDKAGKSILPDKDKEQITEAAFLNFFIAWEGFLEECLAEFMVGAQTLNGSLPIKYASPISATAAKRMAIGTMKYFDYANHEIFRRITLLYFKDGYPFDRQIQAISTDLGDMKIIRNSCAHSSSTTKSSFEALVIRIFGRPIRDLNVYRLLTHIDPRSSKGETIFITYKNRLEVAAEMIARG